MDKGSVFSMRRRRMQIVLASLFVLIGLYIASGSGLLAIFGSNTQAYSDVPSSHYAYEHVQRLNDEGILGNVECSSPKFCPADPTDRKTAAVWIIRMVMEGTPPYVSNPRFSDVDAGDWAAKYIEEFADRGITSGCGDDENGGRKFCPDNNVLRKHMAIFIVRAFDLPKGSGLPPTDRDAGFEDVRSGTYFESINALAAAGITTGCGDGTNFCPDRVITRAQAAIMLGRALEWRDGPVEPEPESEPEPTVSVQAANDPVSSKLLVTADADQDIKGWFYAVIDSHNFSGTNFPSGCRNILTLDPDRQSQVWSASGAMLSPVNNDVKKASIYLDTGYAGRVVCVKATNNGNKTGYSGRRLPSTPPVTEDTQPPLITFKHVPGDSPSLTASANEEVSSWAHIGPLNSAACANNLFGRGSTRLGSRVALDGRDNGKWYCFRAQDAAGNWGFKSRQVPADTIQDTRNPVITVSFQSSGPSLSAHSDETVSNWAHIGPLNSAACANNLFGRGSTRLGSRVALDGRDNGKWYCFRAQDAAGNWGLGSKQVPADAVDTTTPVLSFITYKSESRVAFFRANELVKWGLQYAHNKPSNCSELRFSSTAVTDLKAEHTFSTTSSTGEGSLNWYCLKGVNQAGLVGYSKPYLVDRKKPEVTLSVSDNKLRVTASDDSGIASKKYSIGLPCARATYGSNLPADGLTITASMHSEYACIKVTDQAETGNETKKQHRLVFTPSEPEPTPQLQPASFTSGYQPAQVVDTQYTIAENTEFRQHLDDNFLLATRQSASSEHLSFQLTTPGSFRRSLTGPDIIYKGFAVHAIDYIDVSEKSGCYRELFGAGRKTSVNGLDIENQGALNKVASNTVVRDGRLPLFTFQHRKFACVKVTLWQDESRGVDWRTTYKVFVTANPVEVSTAGAAKYRGMAAEDTYHNFGRVPLDFNHQGNKERLEEHYASRFLVYATEPQVSGGRTTIDLAVNLPGKLILDSLSDIERYAVKQFDFAYLDNAEDCDREAFEGDEFTVQRYNSDKLGQRMVLGFALNRDKHGKYLCVKITLNGDNRSDGDYLGSWDYQPYKVFSLKIDIPGADGSPSRPSRTSNTVSTTETLATITWLRGEERVLSAQPQLEVANIIVNDTWESVALAEDASCGETAFADPDEINQGSEVTNPQADTQYCFRVQDEGGGINYINAFVTDDSFSGLGSPAKQSGVGLVETDANSKLMLIVAIAGGVVLLAVVVSIFVFISQSSRPKFR